MAVFSTDCIPGEKMLNDWPNKTAAYMGFVLWWADEPWLIFSFSIGLLVMGWADSP